MGVGFPFFANQATVQKDEFAASAAGTGHISVESDSDGVFRHVAMVVRVDDSILPTLSLAMFLDYVAVDVSQVEIHWGEEIIIPAVSGSWIREEVKIPIDSQGRAYIPFAGPWNADFRRMTLHRLMEMMQEESLRGNLLDFFEGAFILIGEASVGISDLGSTPLEQDVPLVAIHASLLSALLEGHFYRRWSFWPTAGVVLATTLLLALAAGFRHSKVLYLSGVLVGLGYVWLTWHELLGGSLFPIVSATSASLIVFFGLVVGLETVASRDRAFIRDAFSKYVPERVVKELLLHPEQLQLGGEEKVLTVLFSDLEGFTSASEKMTPTELVAFLNRYLSEMTSVVFEEGGIVDKYLGDGFMAEFGAPIALPDHADRALRSAIRMQERLKQLRQGLGEAALRCRVGINSGPMVIGNVGSFEAFDYTAIGDAVNLASRLEGANRYYGTSILISASTRAQLTTDEFRLRPVDIVKVKGKTEAILIYEVIGALSDPVSEEDAEYLRFYEAGFEAYLARDFEAAEEYFQEAVKLRPTDPSARQLVQRVSSLDSAHLDDDWDGSIQLTGK
jgi:adenylate cyclase